MKKKPSFFMGVITWMILSFIGFSDAVYMTVVHYQGQLPECSAIEGCAELAMSTYSTIGSVPVALFGVIFYTIMLVIGARWLDSRKKRIFKKTPYITVPAFAITLWLMYLMVFVIHALCIYCLISAISTTLLMLISFWLKKLY